jgi:hypothetical protein
VANKAVVLDTGTKARIDPKVKGLTEVQPWTILLVGQVYPDSAGQVKRYEDPDLQSHLFL